MRRRLGTTAAAVTVALALGVPAAVALDGPPAAPSDARVNPARTGPYPTNKQIATGLAVNPTDPTFAVAGGADSRGGTAGAAVYSSADGGRMWTDRGLLDTQPTWRAGGAASTSGARLAYGPRPDGEGGFTLRHGARLYAATTATLPGAPGVSRLVVAWSQDDGSTWSAPLPVAADLAVDPAAAVAIAVDRNPASPRFGLLHVVATRADGDRAIVAAVSADGGASFTGPQLITAGPADRAGAAVSVGPDGSVHLGFRQGEAPTLTSSRDGGRSWSQPAPIAAPAGRPAAGAPALGTDPRLGSRVLYAAWTAGPPGSTRVLVTRSTDQGVSWSTPLEVSSAGEGDASQPALDVSGSGRVDLGYLGRTWTLPAPTVQHGIDPARAPDPADLDGTDPDGGVPAPAPEPTTSGPEQTTGADPAPTAPPTPTAAPERWAPSTVDAYQRSSVDGLLWGQAVRVSSRSGDPAATARPDLGGPDLGDGTQLVSGLDRAWFGYTDARDAVACPAIEQARRLPAPADLPAGLGQCPPGFGDTDIVVSLFPAR